MAEPTPRPRALHVPVNRACAREDLERDLSLHHDVLFSLLTVCQLVIDTAMDRLEPVERFLEIVRRGEAP